MYKLKIEYQSQPVEHRKAVGFSLRLLHSNPAAFPPFRRLEAVLEAVRLQIRWLRNVVASCDRWATSRSRASGLSAANTSRACREMNSGSGTGRVGSAARSLRIW